MFRQIVRPWARNAAIGLKIGKADPDQRLRAAQSVKEQYFGSIPTCR
jgi:hypothetical protein